MPDHSIPLPSSPHNIAEIAYMAGVIDSDGCIRVARSSRAVRDGRGKNLVYAEVVQIKQVENAAVLLAHNLFGGSLTVIPPSSTNRRPMFHWIAHGRIAACVLVTVLPYLRIKREQALNALNLRPLIDETRVRRFRIPEILPGEELLSVTEFAQRTEADIEAIYAGCRFRTIPSIKIDRSRFIPASFVETYLPRARSRGARPVRDIDISVAMEDIYQKGLAMNSGQFVHATASFSNSGAVE